MMGSFVFLVDGWNDNPNELYAIQEIRKFYQHFHTRYGPIGSSSATSTPRRSR
jgi:hypothetical protein